MSVVPVWSSDIVRFSMMTDKCSLTLQILETNVVFILVNIPQSLCKGVPAHPHRSLGITVVSKLDSNQN